MEQAHIYILKNCDEVQPFLEEFSQVPSDSSKTNPDRQFISWFKEKDEMSPLNFKKSEMGSSSKNLKQSFLPPGALARGRGQSLKSMGSVRVTAEKETLIGPTNRMLETLRSKSEKEIGHNFTSMGSVKGSIVVQGTSIGKSKDCSAEYSDRNELASDKNLIKPCLDLIEDETYFPHENLDEMQETARSKPAKENGQNFTSVCSSKESNVEQRMPNGKSKNYSVPASGKNELADNKNLMQPGFDPIEVDTLISYHDFEVMGRGKGFTSLNSIGGSVEMIGNNKEKDIRQNFTSMGFSKGSIVVKGTSIGKSKGCSAAHSDRNEIASDNNLVHPCIDLIEDETSFPHENLDVMQETVRSKPAKEKGQNFTSLNAVRGSVEKRKLIGNNKGLNSAAYDHNGRGTTFQQRTSIRKSKGYSALSSDTNVLAHNKNLRQLDFSQIEHDTTFPHDELEVMQHDLRSKSVFYGENLLSFSRCAKKKTLNGQSKDSENAEYELNELAQNNNRVLSGSDTMEDDPTLPRDEVEVMQDNQRRKTGSSEFEKVKEVRGPNLCKVVTGIKPGEKLRVVFYHNRVVRDHHALFLRHLVCFASNQQELLHLVFLSYLIIGWFASNQ
ncbi:hypothetical protein KY285_025679 [Solanum tuberosum]|nr:hypothetical protein KY285_025679 [Solanum tuberosum]